MSEKNRIKEQTARETKPFTLDGRLEQSAKMLNIQYITTQQVKHL